MKFKNTFITRGSLSIICLLFNLISFAQGIVYVKPTSSGNGSGTSWANATNDIQNVLYYAGTGTKIYMAIGNYNVPVGGFSMKNGAEIYGGFDPDHGITDLNSGRILPSETVEGTVFNGQGSSRVFNNTFQSGPTALSTSAILDGVTIKNGYASGQDGAGMYNVNASPTLRNIVFKTNNSNTNAGAAIFNSSSSPELTNVLFLNNTTDTNKGIFHSTNFSAPILTNVIFKGNNNYAIYSDNSSPYISNALITQNPNLVSAVFAINNGITHLNNATILNINGNTNAVITAVTASISGNIMCGNDILYGNLGQTGGTITTDHCVQSTTLTTIPPTSMFVDYTNGNFKLRYDAPAVNAGLNTLYLNLGATTVDLAGNPRVYQYSNGGVIDCGAYEFCIISDANGITYVKPSSTGTGTGDSWNNATASLQGAIDAPNGTKVYVTIGNYNAPVPNSFKMRNGIAVYGGFDPDNGITSLGQNRILPTASVGGSILNGQNQIAVVRNVYTAGNPMYNTAVLDGFTIANGNRSVTGFGGGMELQYASPVLNNLVFKNNTSNDGGGAMGITSNSSPVLTNVMMLNNTSGDCGGALYIKTNCNPEFTNAYLSGNVVNNATTYGSGIAIFNGCSPKFTNLLLTTTANSGLYAISASNSGGGTCITTLTNATIYTASNSSSGVVPSVKTIDGATVMVNNSIVYGGISNSSGGATNLQSSLNYPNSTPVSPTTVFTNPSTGDLTLKVGSPAIDAGNNNLFPNLTAASKDLAGNQRVYLFGNGGIIDAGAYESAFLVPDANGVVYVKPVQTGNGSGNSWANAASDLQLAINTTNVQRVFAAKGNYNAPAGGFVMKNNVEIYGGFDPDNGVVDLTGNRILGFGSTLNGQNSTRVVNNDFQGNTALNNTAVLDGFSIINGSVTNDFGAGMLNRNASPTLRFVYFGANNASGATGSGGALANINNSSPTITTGWFLNNLATFQGGAVYSASGSNVNIQNFLINGNDCADGSVLYATDASTVITNSRLTENHGLNLMTLVGNASNVTSNNLTIANNTQVNAGAPVNVMQLGAGTTGTINNTIIFGVITGSGSYSAHNSFIEGNSTTTNGNINTTGYTITDILVNPAGSIYTLKGTSPVINAGNNSLFPGLTANSKDMDNNPRVIGSRIDLGAYEFVVTPASTGITYVKPSSTGMGNGSSWANATADMQAAINATGTQKVFVAKGNYEVPSPNSFVMKAGVEIYGGFDPDNGISDLTNNRIMPGSGQGSVLNGKNERPIIWNVNNGVNSTAVLDGFKLTNAVGTSTQGCIYNVNASPTLKNIVISDNNVPGFYGINCSSLITNAQVTNNIGDGIHFEGVGNATITNVTVAGNSSNGLYAFNANQLANFSVAMCNSIIFGTIVNPLSQATTQYSLIENNVIAGNNNVDATNISGQDVFVDPTNENYRLKSTSSAINAGNNALFLGLNGTTLDLAGKARVYASTIDLGAFEFYYTPDVNGIAYVKPTATGAGNGSSWADATSYLQEAINAVGTQQVYVAIGNYDVPSPNSFVMKNAVQIYGGFDPDNGISDLTDNRIMPGSGQGSVLNGKNERPIIWNVNNGVTSSALLDGFELTNATGTGDQGCIYNLFTSPTLTNLLITANNVNGLFGANCNSSITNTAITANNGAGLHFQGAGTATITNVTIAGNTGNALSVNDNFHVNMNNSITYGTFTNPSQVVATYSMVENNAITGTNNVDASGISAQQVFADPSNDNYALTSSSPAINAGNNSLFVGLGSTTLDLAGNMRIVGSSVDLGAYEYNNDIPVPTLANLPDITDACEVASITAPTASNSFVTTITGTPDVTFPITAQDTTIITWTYDDGNGNIATQTQRVIIKDSIAPTPDIATLVDIIGQCEVTSLTAPTATDNCAGTITATSDAILPITTQDTTIVTWTYTDGHGNSATQTQLVIIQPVDVAVSMIESTLTAHLANASYQWINCSDNSAIQGATNQSFTPSVSGSYAVVVTQGNCSDTSACNLVNVVGLEHLSSNNWIIYPNPTTDKLFVETVYEGRISILDVLGNSISTQDIHAGKTSIDVSKLTSGVYFMQMSNGQNWKFIKK